jgi:2-oxoglutarate ferredoxin oxidoreductase subunit alpha
MEELAEQGKRVAMVRPVSLYPFPHDVVTGAASRAGNVLVVELSSGQLIDDVRMAIGREAPIHLLARAGGVQISPDEVIEKVTGMLSEAEADDG